jgi:F0F1-type ATP synthase membrane subunit c/vacuolar-type H+-ATPase subunit K
MGKDVKRRISSDSDLTIPLLPPIFFVRANLLPSTTVPGDGISLTWSLFSPLILNLGLVTARVYLDSNGIKLAESQSTLVSPQAGGVGTGLQTMEILSPGFGQLGNILYALGSKLLRLEVTSDKTNDVFTDTASLTVASDAAPMWTWDPPVATTDPSAPETPAIPFQPTYNLLINNDIYLSGDITLSSARDNVSNVYGGKISLLQKEGDDGTAIVLDDQPFFIPPGATLPITFPRNVKQNWTWLIPGIWVRNYNQPLDKSFVYTVQLDYYDSYNNFYPGVLLPIPLRLNIGVDDQKMAYANGALAAIGLGLTLAVATLGASIGIASTVAGALGAQALDPPVPDSRYGRVLSLPEAPTVSESLFAHERIDNFLKVCAHFLELVEILGDTVNRYLGAKEAKARGPVDKQRAAISRIVRLIEELSGDLSRHATLAVNSSIEGELIGEDGIEFTLRRWERTGIPPELELKLFSQGMTENSLVLMNAALKSEEIIVSARNVPRAIVSITTAILQGGSSSIVGARFLASQTKVVSARRLDARH